MLNVIRSLTLLSDVLHLITILKPHFLLSASHLVKLIKKKKPGCSLLWCRVGEIQATQVCAGTWEPSPWPDSLVKTKTPSQPPFLALSNYFQVSLGRLSCSSQTPHPVGNKHFPILVWYVASWVLAPEPNYGWQFLLNLQSSHMTEKGNLQP